MRMTLEVGQLQCRLVMEGGEMMRGRGITAFASSPHPLFRHQHSCESVLVSVSIKRTVALESSTQGQAGNIAVHSSQVGLVDLSVLVQPVISIQMPHKLLARQFRWHQLLDNDFKSCLRITLEQCFFPFPRMVFAGLDFTFCLLH